MLYKSHNTSTTFEEFAVKLNVLLNAKPFAHGELYISLPFIVEMEFDGKHDANEESPYSLFFEKKKSTSSSDESMTLINNTNL
jgi:hypothetical protein